MVTKEISPKEERTALGIVLMVTAVTFFTCIDTSAKWLILSGLPVLQVVFARYAVHFLLSLATFVPQHGPSVIMSKRPALQFLRSAFLFGSTLLNFLALQYLPITVTTTIMFSGPIVVTLLAIPILGEKVGLRRLLAVCVGFVGVIVVMQPWGVSFHPAAFLSVGSVLSASLYFILTRMLAGIESNATSQIWSSGLAAFGMLPLALPVWVWPETTTGFAVLILIGLFGACGHICATAAHRFADASILAPVVYFQMLLAAISGILVFNTWPTIWTLVGGLIIIGSGIYIWQRERAKGRAPTPANTQRTHH